MRKRALLSLCLPLVVVSCRGGLLPSPTPAPAPALGPTATRVHAAMVVLPTPRPRGPASPTPSALQAPPEVAAGLVPAQERDRYLRFVDAVRARDEAAAEWLLHSGLFLQDARLGAEELQALDVVQQRAQDDPLWYLTHVRVLNGVNSQDVAYLQDNDAVPGDLWYFDDDVSGLEAAELLSRDGGRSLQRISERARHDPEVRRGLYLVNTLGLPDSRAFKYAVPSYNVQLYVLAWLLEQGIPGEYERAAVAAALTYGSLATLCDKAAREEVLRYAAERVRFLIDTDVLLAAAGANWRSTNYPLEALVLLLWGGQASAYPQPDQPLGKAPYLSTAAATRPFGRDDLARLLVPLTSLRQMQDEMMRAVVERTSDPALAADMAEQWWSTRRRDEAGHGGPDLGRQWQRFRDGRGFAGGTEAGYVLQGLAASINLPLPWAQLWYLQRGSPEAVPFGLRLDPNSRTIQMGPSALRATAGLPADTRAALVWYRVPWDNWHLPGQVRSSQTVPLPLAVWRAGLPSGYLWRGSVAGEAETLAALGIQASSTPVATEKKP